MKLFIAIIGFAQISLAQFIWNVRIDGQVNPYVNTVVDNESNHYLTFQHRNNAAVFDALGNSVLDIVTSTDQTALVVVKLSQNGSYVWHAEIRGNDFEFEIRQSIRCDSQNNVYVIGNQGSFRTRIIDSTGIEVANTTQDSDPYSFLIKFNSTGNYQWHAVADGVDIQRAIQFDVSSQDEIVVAYTNQNGNMKVFDSTGDEVYMLAYQSQSNAVDTALVKFNSQGILQWVLFFYAIYDNRILAISFDYEDNIVICGQTSSFNQIVYDRNNNIFANITRNYPTGSNPYLTGFVMKFMSNSSFVWSADIAPDTSLVSLDSIAADIAGNVYVGAYFDANLVSIHDSNGDVAHNISKSTQNGGGQPESLDFSASLRPTITYDIFLVKYNSSGFYQHSNEFSGEGNDVFKSLAVKPNGRLAASFQIGNFPLVVKNSDGSTYQTFNSMQAYGQSGIVYFNESGFGIWRAEFGNDYETSVQQVIFDKYGQLSASGYFTPTEGNLTITINVGEFINTINGTKIQSGFLYRYRLPDSVEDPELPSSTTSLTSTQSTTSSVLNTFTSTSTMVSSNSTTTIPMGPGTQTDSGTATVTGQTTTTVVGTNTGTAPPPSGQNGNNGTSSSVSNYKFEGQYFAMIFTVFPIALALILMS